MLITIQGILAPDEIDRMRAVLAAGPWEDGARTGGSLGSKAKHNEQFVGAEGQARELGNIVLRKLGASPRFMSAALPHRIHPPRFNRYRGGGTYGTHVDGAVMFVPETGVTLRSDLSATLFLSDPAGYDGGELEIETPFGAQAVKLAAGDLVLYPASSLHRVTPVTRGERLASFFWIESLVADEGARAQLFDLDEAIQALQHTLEPTDPRLLKLTGVYHNLLRRWART
jgi:PKHD-type hydroxylase